MASLNEQLTNESALANFKKHINSQARKYKKNKKTKKQIKTEIYK